jgi:peptidoglycan/LPS O-acetylase OafA/YrhL
MMSEQSHTKRLDIEGLRAVAVTVVILFHLHITGFSGGFVGVDIFFVISGFLITSLLLRERHSHGRIDLMAFWMRRARRLLPNAFLVLACVLLASFAMVPAYRWGEVTADVFAALAFYANFHFSAKAVDYFFVNSTPSAVLHFWSLSVEEQFYVLWPLIIAATTAMIADRKHKLLLLIILAASLASFVANVLMIGTNQPNAFLGFVTRIWQLGVGAALATWFFAHVPSPQVSNILSWVGAIGIAVSIFFFDESLRYPGWWAMLPTLSCAAMIAGGAGAPNAMPSRMLGYSVLQWIGARSYSLYLWHWPLIVFLGPLIMPPWLRDSVLLPQQLINSLKIRSVPMT